MSDEEREYLNEMIRSLNNRLVDALRERDEARRELCLHRSIVSITTKNAFELAKQRGWDCFKEKADGATD